ncbi:MAG: FKBP-type peptidyl-prolyl cis-trans isomerase [Mariprofundales bacterium]|nr:FKBP-type peptidyl-prolyl cis-trans isomerase [Mariprofundales bacterium]
MNPSKKFTTIALATAALLVGACSSEATSSNAAPTPLKSESSKFSYAVGLNFGSSLQRFPVKLDKAALLEAIQTSIDHGKPRISPADARKVIQTTMKKKQEKAMFARKAKGGKNKKAGEAFLAENAKKAGVKTTASGLQYIILTEGDGAVPKATDKVKVNYKGTLIDGTVFDSSYDRGKPVSFPLNGVIKGWTEGLQLIKVGGKIRLFLPSDLAYGKRGAGGKIGPNSTLIFDVELLAIE